MLSPRTGRPTDDPKHHETRIRMSDEDVEILEYCCKATGRTKADIIREGIREVYAKLKNKSNRSLWRETITFIKPHPQGDMH